MSPNSKDIITFGFPYLIAVGACYQFGYWGAIGVNVLEFVGVADVLKLALYPLLAVMAASALGVIFTLLSVKVVMPKFLEGRPSDSGVTRFGRRYRDNLLQMATLGAFAVVVLGPEPYRWFAIPSLLQVFAVPASNWPLFSKIIPKYGLRYAVLMMTLVLPGLSFAMGRLGIHAALASDSAQTVDVARSNLPLLSEPGFPVVYLGLLGTTYVLCESKTGEIVFIKEREEAPLFVSRTKR